MKCTTEGCPGEYEQREVVHTVRQDDRIIVIDHVPAEVCTVCGDVLFTPRQYVKLNFYDIQPFRQNAPCHFMISLKRSLHRRDPQEQKQNENRTTSIIRSSFSLLSAASPRSLKLQPGSSGARDSGASDARLRGPS